MQSRRTMTWGMCLAAVVVAGAALCSPIATAEARPLEVDVWTSRDDGDAVCVGDPVDVYFGANQRAAVIVYAVDADGWVHILFPSRAWEDGMVRGDRVYRIPAHRVDDLLGSCEGLVLIGAVAARERLPVARWFESDGVIVFSGERSWEVPGVRPRRAVIGRVVGDPFKAVWTIEDALLPGGMCDGHPATDLCWLSVDTVGPSPVCVVINGRPRWECHPRFHLVFNLEGCFDWPRCVVRECVHRVVQRASFPVSGAGAGRIRQAAWKWKEKKEKNPQKEWNQREDSCVLVSERSKETSIDLLDRKKSESRVKPQSSGKRLENRKNKKKVPPASNKPTDKGYSDRKGHEGSSKEGTALGNHAGRHKKK